MSTFGLTGNLKSPDRNKQFISNIPRSPWKLRSRDIGEKAKQNSARNNAKCSKCFKFLCNNSDRTCFFNALTFARSLGRC